MSNKTKKIEKMNIRAKHKQKDDEG